MGKVLRSLKKAVKPVRTERPKGALPKPVKIEELEEATTTDRKTTDFVEIELTSSKGKRYRVVVPQSIAKAVPKKWEWNEVRYKVADLIAEGIPILHIAKDPAVGVSSRMTIYAWLEHPEFREHVDGLVLETGFANKRERIAGMNRLTAKLFQKVMDELNKTKLNEKSVGAILTAISTNMKYLSQEKEEFVESQKVESDVNLNAKVATINVTEALKSKSEEERKQLEQEFDALGDDLIRSLTGGK